MNTSETGIDAGVGELLQQLTLREKISLLSGKDMWSTMPVDQLEIPSVVMTYGLHGVRLANPATGRVISPATAFPSGKLTITLPRKSEHSPAYINTSYDRAREVRYGEGIFMGYRSFDQRRSEPLCLFGHGFPTPVLNTAICKSWRWWT
jgi:hypothetical protein